MLACLLPKVKGLITFPNDTVYGVKIMKKHLPFQIVLSLGIITLLHGTQVQAEAYKYDDLGRLIEVIKDDFEFTGYDEHRERATYIASERELYEYDILGNRIQKQTQATRTKK